jgi:hypothetical protein
MCLSVALHRPNDLLAKGEHLGHEWNIMHNGTGFRCGYVKVLPGHPWFGRDLDDVDAAVHGCITYSKADKPCDAEGPDNGWWVGFDCAHGQDKPDPSLIPGKSEEYVRAFDWPGAQIRSQEYVEAECRSLCEQAAAAA